jgi:hypothetical protein
VANENLVSFILREMKAAKDRKVWGMHRDLGSLSFKALVRDEVLLAREQEMRK